MIKIKTQVKRPPFPAQAFRPGDWAALGNYVRNFYAKPGSGLAARALAKTQREAPPLSAKWAAEKRRRGLDPRRGVATGAALRELVGAGATGYQVTSDPGRIVVKTGLSRGRVIGIIYWFNRMRRIKMVRSVVAKHVTKVLAARIAKRGGAAETM